MVFTFVNGFGGEGSISYELSQLHEIKFSESINGVLLEHSHVHGLCFVYDCVPATRAKLGS